MEGSCIPGFTEEQLTTVKLVKITVASSAIVMCVLAVAVIIIHKAYKQFIYRLVLYLMVVDLIQAVSNILEGVPIEIRSHNLHNQTNCTEVVVTTGWKSACAVFAFGNQITVWMENLMILWILFYLIFLITKILKPQNFSNSHAASAMVNNHQHVTQKELFGLLFTLFFPFTFNWLPFILNSDDGGMYGISGLWCWIKLTDDDYPGDYTMGLGLMFGLFYAPLILIILFGFISFIVMVVIMCKRSRLKKGVDWTDQKLYKRGLREIFPLLLYPFLYNLISVVLVLNRIVDAAQLQDNKNPVYALWLMHAIADPGRVLIPPLAFIFHRSTWKNFCYKKCNSDGESQKGTSFHVKAEFSDESVDSLRLTDRHNEQRKSYGSIFMDTTMQDRLNP